MPDLRWSLPFAITLQTYSHVLPTVQDEAAATVAATFMPAATTTQL